MALIESNRELTKLCRRVALHLELLHAVGGDVAVHGHGPPDAVASLIPDTGMYTVPSLRGRSLTSYSDSVFTHQPGTWPWATRGR